MVCKKCGKRLKEGEMFCTVCGYFNDPNDTSNYDDNKKGMSEFFRNALNIYTKE